MGRFAENIGWRWGLLLNWILICGPTVAVGGRRQRGGFGTVTNGERGERASSLMWMTIHGGGCEIKSDYGGSRNNKGCHEVKWGQTEDSLNSLNRRIQLFCKIISVDTLILLNYSAKLLVLMLAIPPARRIIRLLDLIWSLILRRRRRFSAAAAPSHFTSSNVDNHFVFLSFWFDDNLSTCHPPQFNGPRTVSSSLFSPRYSLVIVTQWCCWRRGL